MLRCITELKGLAVDIDSFPVFDSKEWLQINSIVPCVFLTSDHNTEKMINSLFGISKCMYLEKYIMLLAPNELVHLSVLLKLGIKNTELAYLSHSHLFLKNANNFLCGTIWITTNITYEQASCAPDMIRHDLNELKEALHIGMKGFFGEVRVSPLEDSKGIMIPIEFFVDNTEVPLYSLGRYFKYEHYMGQLHPYSTALYYNKKPYKKYTGVLDNTFEKLYTAAIKKITDLYLIDCVCSVPVKPGKRARFDGILRGISNNCNINNISQYFRCIKDYPDQKALSADQRESNIKGAFSYCGNLSGHTVVLIDDIISSGSTVSECVRELKRHDALNIIVVVLAINQFGTYWSSDKPMVRCPKCGKQMNLFLNSKGEFFYNCLNCFHSSNNTRSTLDFAKGWEQLCDDENNKFVRSENQTDGSYDAENYVDVKCPFCTAINTVKIKQISDSSIRKGELEDDKEIDYTQIKCKNCHKTFQVRKTVIEYPEGPDELIVTSIDLDESL